MPLKKMIIASLMLLIYSVGIAHHAIPHCHDALDGPDEAHAILPNHEHHDKDHEHSKGSPDHMHIAHQGHLDDGLLDLLYCLITETEHPDSDDGKHYLPPKASQQKIGDRTGLQLFAATLLLFADFVSEPSPRPFQREVQNFYSPPYLAYSTYRGPPICS